MARKVVEHPTDEGKWMLSEDLIELYGEAYGHDQGKSKQAVYKWIKRRDAKREEEDTAAMDAFYEEPEAEPTVESGGVESSTDWVEVDWRNPSDADQGTVDDTPDTINPAVRALGGAGTTSANLAKKQAEIQGRVARYGFVAADRLVTWWGRGVTNNPQYELKRSKADLDLLEETTIDVMEYYGISIPVNPLMVWGITVGAAYVPPVMDIRKNADPNRIKRGGLLRFIPFIGRRYRNDSRRKAAEESARSRTTDEA